MKALITYLQKEFGKNYLRINDETIIFQRTGEYGPYRKDKLTARTINKIVKKYVDKAGIDKRITPHSFRHRVLTEALRKQVDLKTVMLIAGHSSIVSTQQYLHTDDNLMREAINKVAIK